MKLPGATYGAAVQSLGRLQGPTESGASASMAAGAARAAVYGAMQKTLGVAEAWFEAEEEVRAMRAINDYKDTMSNLSLQIKNSPALKADDIPDGVTFERERTNDAGEKVVRETVPSWEVGPAILDNQHRLAAQKAMSQMRSTKGKAAVENAISDSYRAYGNDMAAYHLGKKKETLVTDIQLSVQKASERGDEAAALAAIDTGVRTGLLSTAEGFTMATRARNDAAVRKFGLAIAGLEHSTAPYEQKMAAYDAIKAQALSNPGALTAAQQVEVVNRAGDQQARLVKAQEAAITKARDEESDRIYNRVKLNFTTGGRLPTNAELAAMERVMKPEDFRAMITFVDDKRKSGGKGVDNPAVKNAITDQFAQFYEPQPRGGNAENLERNLQRQINDAVVAKQLTHETAEKLRTDAKQSLELAIGQNNPAVKRAHESIKGYINPPPELVNIGGADDYWHHVTRDFQADLRAAMASNPRLDPEAWVKDNAARYKKRLNDEKVKDVRKAGFDSALTFDKTTGNIDIPASTRNFDKLQADGVLTKDKRNDMVKIINGINVDATKGRKPPAPSNWLGDLFRSGKAQKPGTPSASEAP